MGIREWGFPIKCDQDVNDIIKLVDLHNQSDDNGETLEITCIFKYKNKLYMTIGNSGGGYSTSDFIRMHYNKTCYYPFQKPVWWYDMEKQQILWNNNITLSQFLETRLF